MSDLNNNNKNRVPSSASSITSYASLSSMNSSSTTTATTASSNRSNIEQYWLPPISTLLSGINAATNSENKALNSITKKKRKLSQPATGNNNNTSPVYLPMIPYYFHHEQFGIEACMLQLEGQKKFNNYYYI